MDEEIQAIIKEVKSYDKSANIALIEKAFEYAKKAHVGQKRVSGEDYIYHPLAVVKILLDMKPDVATICAALLHDTVEETSSNFADIKRNSREV